MSLRVQRNPRRLIAIGVALIVVSALALIVGGWNDSSPRGVPIWLLVGVGVPVGVYFVFIGWWSLRRSSSS